jgi:hypothetical protein
MRSCLKAIVLAATLAGNAASAHANERAESTALLNGWYAALPSASSETGLRFFSGVLAQDAQIRLNDLGIIQNREDFIDSLESVGDALEGARIAHRIDGEAFTADSVTMIVCYIFADNEYLTREVFTISGGKVAVSDQSQIAESCDSF